MNNNFNWIFYLTLYPDLAKRGVNTYKTAYWHWLKFGKVEGRICSPNNIPINKHRIIKSTSQENNKVTPGISDNISVSFKITDSKFNNINTINEFYEKVLPLYNNIWIQYYTIPYYTALFQRPQHICNNMSIFNFLSIYMEVRSKENEKEIEYNKEYNIWIFRSDLNKIPFNYSQNIFISIYSTISMPFDEIYKIKKIKNNKIFLIYEYIDDIDPKICGSEHNKQILLKNKSFAFENFDILIASADKLFEELPKNKKCILVNNGCDINHYQSKLNKRYTGSVYKIQYNKLFKFKNKFKIILGYFGAIAPWLDYEIINNIIKKRYDIGFVFIGPDYLNQIKNIKNQENLLILGAIDYKILPYFAYKFDICFIPFENGEIARTTSPLKLFEFFCMKKPVICSKYMLECIKYKEVLSYDTLESFNNCINKSILLMKNNNYKNKLNNIANNNTWEKICIKMINHIK